MKKYRDADILYAKNLRESKGYSFAELQRITGIPATTIRNWCQEFMPTNRWDTLLLSNDRKRQVLRSSEHSIFETLEELSVPQAKIYAALLYWCEGWKYPSSNKVGFTNSDPMLIKLFLALFRYAFEIDEGKIRAHLQLHTTHDIGETTRFWSELLNIPYNQFIKPTITKMRGGKHRKEYQGTCTIRYSDFRIQLRLMGISEAFVKRFGEVEYRSESEDPA